MQDRRCASLAGETTPAPDADGSEFQLAVPAGPAEVPSWFFDATGNEIDGRIIFV